MSVYAVDIGGSSLKHGLTTASTYKITKNYMRMSAKQHAIQIRRPVERGYVVNWTLQGDILQDILPNNKEHTLLLTTPLFTPEKLLLQQEEVVFEEFQFEKYSSVVPQSMVFKPIPFACVVDLGFSSTYIVPLIDGKVLLSAVRRLNVGGKLLTNYLKECVSYRQWNMMDSFELIDEVKEAVCKCSLSFINDMKEFANGTATTLQWALPDFVQTKNGYLMEPQTAVPDSTQVLRLGLEQITVPEILFHPSDIGLDQAGLHGGIVEAISACPEHFQSLLYQNIILTGGTSQLPNLKERLEKELRPLVPAEYLIQFHTTNDPIGAVWKGCQALASSGSMPIVTKAEYQEHGSNICRTRLGNL
ncbi:hypothetical protein THRCLA_07584 [Thraustotheca clavata]|uniref:Actin n=1 Tax=Thraustotheca clavata TaxID=74557 RepID=A0A1V9ZCV0_9STRA|nr:hypothetical protein THRCLA_07584 [Thraustotheca clavata]